MKRFIKAYTGMKSTVIYTDTDGSHFRFSGGTWTWRNHNPGNVRPKIKGVFKNQIGKTHHFAIFPNDESGREALIEVLKTVYWNSSIDQMIQIFAPPKENPTKKYARFLHEKTGVTDNTKIKNFTSNQFEKLWKTIQQMEGYKIGNITDVYRVNGIQILNNRIYQFCLNQDDWISKSECISLARQGRVELEICISDLGKTFLRSIPNSDFQPKLHDLIEK